MRLLFVIHQFFPDCRSGTEQYCLAVARAARDAGDEVTILSLNWDHDRDWPPIRLMELPYDGFRVLRLDHWRRINPNDVLRDYDNRHVEGWFRAVLDDVRPAAVHFFHLRQLGSGLIRVAREAGLRTVVNLMDFWFLCPRFTLLRADGTLCQGPPNRGAGCIPCQHPELADTWPQSGPAALSSDPPARLRALLDRPAAQLRALAMADAVVAPSHFLAGMFARNGFPAERITVVPYGLAAGRITARPVSRPRTPLQLGFCGVLSPWKAPHVAIEAVRGSDAKVSLHLHGNAEEPMFADYIRGLRQLAGDDPRITFDGAFDEAAASTVFAGLDALVVPSTWYENTPFVVLEAFAAGIPVLASDLGGLSEVVQHGHNGLLFPAGDAMALRALIERLVDEPDLHRRLVPAPPHDVAEDHRRLAALWRGS
ncbi:MAG: glycosyltransferase [Planctomycetes bacterium]|jgi:glycosyltransferase involved in cell wall biosynthesis|nr:glycosyltransferase [Planctomycetota bacterium]